MRKRITKVIVSIAIFAMVITGIGPDVAYRFAPIYFPEYQNIEAFGTDEVYAATAKTITVKKANKSTAKKIHKAIVGGKPAKLKVKGNRSKADRTVKDLQKLIRSVNKQGVIFKFKRENTAGGYVYYSITDDNAKAYMYAVKFIDKLYKNIRKVTNPFNKKVLEALQTDANRYPDVEVRKSHILFEMYSKYFETQYGPVHAYSMYTGENPPFNSKAKHKLVRKSDYTIKILTLIKDERYMLPEDEEIVEAMVDKASVDDDGNITITLKTYANFMKTAGIKERIKNDILWYHNFWQRSFGNLRVHATMGRIGEELYFSDQMYIIYNTKNFCDLSDAMKIWAIEKSGYFDCSELGYGYGMGYTEVKEVQTGAKAMESLYKNKAEGVCYNFAHFEDELFKQLGIKSWFNESYILDHAWSVVKVKNSKGKTLWIPFDYGIGPNPQLDWDSEAAYKIIKSEKKAYKEYLKGIPGASKKKNFIESDFN